MCGIIVEMHICECVVVNMQSNLIANVHIVCVLHLPRSWEGK